MALAMITPIYAGLIGLLIVFLAWRIVRLRVNHQVGLGDGGQKDLMRAVRVHANLIEYAPVAILLLLLVEMLGFSAMAVHGLGLLLLVARVLHAYGLTHSSTISFGRKWGTVLTWAMMTIASVLCLFGTFGKIF